jgi:hypothetical protein
MEDKIVTIPDINKRATEIVEVMNCAFPGTAGSSENIYAMICVAVATGLRGVKTQEEFDDRLKELARCMGDYACNIHETLFPEMYVDTDPTATRH